MSMTGLLNNLFEGFGLSLVFPLILFIVISVFMAITSGK